MSICQDFLTVKRLPLLEHGWLHADTAEGLAELLRDETITRVVEVGSWLGTSAKFICECMKDRKAVLFCVDPWIFTDQTRPLAVCPEDIFYEQFLSNVLHWGLTKMIVPIRATSIEAATIHDDAPIDLVYVDGHHSREAVASDILAWWPNLREGGIMCGDDYCWEGVAEGVADAAMILSVTVTTKRVGRRASFWQLSSKEFPCPKES